MTQRWAAVGLLLALCTCRNASEEATYREGSLALQRGDLHAAAAIAGEGARRVHHDANGRWAWAYRVLEAEILVSQRRNHEALELLRDLGASLEEWPDLRARALMTRAYAHCWLGEGASSDRGIEGDFAASERVAGMLNREDLRGEVRVRRGVCAVVQGDAVVAETHLQGALDLGRREGLGFLEAHATASLGFLHLRSGRYDQAADWLAKALSLTASLQMDNVALKTLGNLGWCHLQLGDLDRALAFLMRAESLATRLGYSGDLRTILTNIGNVHFRQGDHEGAQRVWERALAASRDLGDKRAIADSLGSVAMLALERKQLDEAERYAQEALRLEQEVGDLADQEETRLTQGRILAARGDTDRASALLRAVIASPHTTDAIRWETHAALAGLLVAKHRVTDAESEFRRAFGVMEGMRAGLRLAEHKISFFSSLARYYDDYVDLLMAQGQPVAALAVADRSRALYLREILGDRSRAGASTNARFQDIARGQGASLLFYWTAPERSFVWCVTPERVDVRELPGEQVLAQRVRSYQRLILRSRDPLAEGNADGVWLYRTLVEPFASEVRGGRVIVVPDGPLHELSFETLIAPAPHPHYWVEDVTLARAPALGLVETGACEPKLGAAPEARSILLIGDPLAPNAEFPRLPHAAREMQRIMAQFPASASVVHSGAEAEPGAFRRALPERFAFVHFAAHAVASFEQPLESAVVLSPKGDTFKLYARDIVGTPLRADLVTLSACYGAGARHYAGEGFVGLAWAFLGSGARNVVAGLWNVEETSTAELMETLYRGLAEGLEPPEALRAAQLAMLRSRSAYHKPYYWGAFVTYTRQWASASPRAARR